MPLDILAALMCTSCFASYSFFKIIKALAKQQHYDSLLRKNSNNPKKSWLVIREIIDNKSTSNINLPPTLRVNNKAYEADSNEFLDHMCKYFANIGSTLAKKVNKAHDSKLKVTSKSCLHSFVIHDVTENEVSIAIENLKSNSAPGIDSIPPKFVKMAKMLLTPLLTKLYNKCLIQDFFPDVFKVSQVIPIPKTAAPKELGDFRPISLLNIFAKIFEKILKDKIMEFIDNNNILSSNQYGFRANNSTELAVTTIYDEFLENLDRKLCTCAIFLDIKKAFDTIDHQILLKKLYHYGFSRENLEYF